MKSVIRCVARLRFYIVDVHVLRHLEDILCANLESAIRAKAGQPRRSAFSDWTEKGDS